MARLGLRRTGTAIERLYPACRCLNLGFATWYLAVVLDWFSRRVLSWRVSITMEAAFCAPILYRESGNG
jgi:transposase InsO family protein